MKAPALVVVALILAGCVGYFGLLTKDQRRAYLGEAHPDWLAAADEPCEDVPYVYKEGGGARLVYCARRGPS